MACINADCISRARSGCLTICPADGSISLMGRMSASAIALHSSVEIVCSGSDAEDLLYAWLNAVVYEMAIRRMVFGRFDVAIDGGTLGAVAWGESLLPERHQPAVEIKGATFTGLKVRKEGDEWVAECVVDV